MKHKKSTTKKVIAAAFFAVFISACGNGCRQQMTATMKNDSGMKDTVIIDGSSGSDPEQQITVTMKITRSNVVRIGISGSKSVSIDWGDGETENRQYEHENKYLPNGLIAYNSIKHKYSTASDRTVTVTGNNIIYLQCSFCTLTDLDVSKSTSLTELH
jgi:hypothetical protein